MVKTVKRKLVVITTVYWFLLLYIIAALLWWFIALNNQNKALTVTRLAELNVAHTNYQQQKQQILALQKRKTAQYIGEGITFLAIILIGAVYVYRATRKQILLSAQQQNFMMAVTHELKTPIAITTLNLETLQKRKLQEEQQQKIISSTLQEADRLNLLSNNILLAAQLDGGAYNSNKQLINFSEIVENTAKTFSNRFQHYKIEALIEPGIFLSAEQLLLQMLVNNLVENAIKYSPKNSTIKIQLQQNNQAAYLPLSLRRGVGGEVKKINRETKSAKKIMLSIADEGLGIADNEKKKIFQKFYRIGNENTRTTKGTGLGLYLCKQICKSHLAKIYVVDNKPKGSIFKVEFFV